MEMENCNTFGDTSHITSFVMILYIPSMFSFGKDWKKEEECEQIFQNNKTICITIFE